MTQEALKLALEALGTCGEDEWHSDDDCGMMQFYDEDKVNAAITAIKEALAQPVQEPVAWEQFYPDIGKPQIAFNAEVVGYVAPQRTWVGLTNDEVNNFAAGCHLGNSVQGAIYKAEAKLKEKNT